MRMLRSRIERKLTRASKFDGWSLALAALTLRSRSLSMRSCYVSAVHLDLGELSVNQSHNYLAGRGIRPNPLERPLHTAL